ncbi:glycoside hydrolase family 32 protein [Granulicella arctica]|uniref:glycoside hydrolase family 32 protein n=1 Tax=Granulicella arctica TaxID=940613 RepID=UPI0021E0F587|nr:glycoside hydrolase family 32 protein [Granulicella arctica]
MKTSRRSALKSIALASAASLVNLRAAGAQADVDVPITDPLRPSFHYQPARNWMNDPCGPIYFHGQYHLFHQYNPHGPLWGDMHWAHAVSPDMIHWKRLPVALAPTPDGPDAQGCFTGTAVVHDGRPTFLYTGVQTSPLAEATLADPKNPLRESQCLAVATDDTLETWKKVPAAVIPVPPAGMKVTGFRDPSPWKDGDSWYTIVGSGIAKKGGMVLLYRSTDLRTWEYLHPLYEGTWTGKITSDSVDSGEMWECPEFFPLVDTATKVEKHILIYSTEGKVLWNSGTLDRDTMRFTAEKTGQLDYGRVGTNRVTFYAPKTQLDAKGNRILWGWIGETRPDAECVRAGWSGLMSLPRLLTLQHGELHIQPASQTVRLREPASKPTRINEIIATIETADTKPAAHSTANVLGGLLSLRSDPTQDPNTLHLSFSNGIPPIMIPLPSPLGKRASLHAFIDNSVLEIFIDGRFCLTHRFYSQQAGEPLATITVAGSYSVASSQTHGLHPIWPT